MTYPPERWDDVGQWVRVRMLRKGWNQGDLAQAAGLSPETVRPFTNGTPAERAPASMAKVAIALGEPGDAIIRILDGEHAVAVDGDRFSSLEETIHSLGENLREIAARLDRAGL